MQGDSVKVHLVEADTRAAEPVAKPSTESFSNRMVVELSSVCLRPLGLELCGVQAAVSCCTWAASFSRHSCSSWAADDGSATASAVNTPAAYRACLNISPCPSNADLLTKCQHLSVCEQAVTAVHLHEVCIMTKLQQSKITVQAHGSRNTCFVSNTASYQVLQLKPNMLTYLVPELLRTRQGYLGL